MSNKTAPKFIVVFMSIVLVSCGAISIQTQQGYYPAFIKAAQMGDIAEADKLLRSGELVNQKTIGDRTALHLAAAEGQDNMVRWLLAHEANPLAQDQNGETPAEFALSQGHPQTAQIILDYIQLVKNEEKAVQAGDVETLRKLLLQDERKYTVLHIAAQMGASQLVANEIRLGADVNAQTANGLTPLHKAVISGNIEICQLILGAGGDVNAVDVYNNTPLYYAILYNNKDLVKLFLEAGANVNIRSIWGNETLIDFAKREGNAEIIALLEGK